MTQRIDTLEQRQQQMRNLILQRKWRSRMRAQGFCGECFQNKAGGIGGTGTRCPKCADKHRERNRKGWIARGKPGRPKGSKNQRPLVEVYVKPEPAEVVEALLRREELRAKMNPVRITMADLRGRSTLVSEVSA